MRWSTIAITAMLLSAAIPAGAASGPKDAHDAAFALGVLWRAQYNACPGVRFDPEQLAAASRPQPMSAAALKQRYKRDFDKGYALAGEAIQSGDASQYCATWVVGFFGGKQDIFGHARSFPEQPAPGLTLP